MTRRGGDRLLNWGFAVALTLHAAALACAARLPIEPTTGPLDNIRVFEDDASAHMIPVDVVEWPAQPPTEPEPSLHVTTAPPEIVPQAPPREPTPRPAKRPEPEPPREQTPLAAPQPATPTPPEPVRPPEPAEARPPEAPPVSDGTQPGGGGGGGGGSVDLGAPSPGGDLTAVASGGTAMGEVPGVGSGFGTGVGAGSGGGTGGGSGGGTGTGDGTGVGEGSGSGAGGGQGDGGAPGFVSRTAEQQEPVVVYKGSLEYPPAAAAEGVEGTVRLEVAVTELGTVSDIRVVESSRDRRLDAAAVEFVRGWRYKPAIQDGKPRSVWTHAVVAFELE